jgi:Zn-dependent M28 family amino/carboxypeptidase
MIPRRVEAMSESDRSIRRSLHRHVSALAVEIGPRPALVGHGLLEAERYIRGAFADAGLAVEDQPYEYFGRKVANLIAVPPHASTRPYYLIAAHYDSVPGTPGADDNASAVAVMLTLAERLRRPPVPLRFAAFTLRNHRPL